MEVAKVKDVGVCNVVDAVQLAKGIELRVVKVVR